MIYNISLSAIKHTLTAIWRSNLDIWQSYIAPHIAGSQDVRLPGWRQIPILICSPPAGQAWSLFNFSVVSGSSTKNFQIASADYVPSAAIDFIWSLSIVMDQWPWPSPWLRRHWQLGSEIMAPSHDPETLSFPSYWHWWSQAGVMWNRNRRTSRAAASGSETAPPAELVVRSPAWDPTRINDVPSRRLKSREILLLTGNVSRKPGDMMPSPATRGNMACFLVFAIITLLADCKSVYSQFPIGSSTPDVIGFVFPSNLGKQGLGLIKSSRYPRYFVNP